MKFTSLFGVPIAQITKSELRTFLGNLPKVKIGMNFVYSEVILRSLRNPDYQKTISKMVNICDGKGLNWAICQRKKSETLKFEIKNFEQNWRVEKIEIPKNPEKNEQKTTKTTEFSFEDNTENINEIKLQEMEKNQKIKFAQKLQEIETENWEKGLQFAQKVEFGNGFKNKFDNSQAKKSGNLEKGSEIRLESLEISKNKQNLQKKMEEIEQEKIEKNSKPKNQTEFPAKFLTKNQNKFQTLGFFWQSKIMQKAKFVWRLFWNFLTGLGILLGFDFGTKVILGRDFVYEIFDLVNEKNWKMAIIGGNLAVQNNLKLKFPKLQIDFWFRDSGCDLMRDNAIELQNWPQNLGKFAQSNSKSEFENNFEKDWKNNSTNNLSTLKAPELLPKNYNSTFPNSTQIQKNDEKNDNQIAKFNFENEAIFENSLENNFENKSKNISNSQKIITSQIPNLKINFQQNKISPQNQKNLEDILISNQPQLNHTFQKVSSHFNLISKSNSNLDTKANFKKNFDTNSELNSKNFQPALVQTHQFLKSQTLIPNFPELENCLKWLENLNKKQEIDLVLICIGGASGKQEFLCDLICQNENLKFRSAICLGAALDHLGSGKKQQESPKWMQKLGLEWLFRFAFQPYRRARIWDSVVGLWWEVSKNSEK